MDPRRPDWKLIACVMLLALVLRVASAERSLLIAADASRFLNSAERVEAGDFQGAIADVYHPLTAYATGAVNAVQRAAFGVPPEFRAELLQRERAAHLVVLLAGLLLVWLQMDLAFRLFPRAPALVVGLLAASHPYFVRSSADIMSDTPCLAFMMLALRQGVVATVSGDQIPFSGFLAGETMLMLQRKNPDSMGSRQVLLPYQRIDSLKITEVVDGKVYEKIGFVGSLPKR
jgi:hypothetical protein